MGGSALLTFPLVLVWHYYSLKQPPTDVEVAETKKTALEHGRFDSDATLPPFPRALLPAVNHITVRDASYNFAETRKLAPDVPVSVDEPDGASHSARTSIAPTDIHFVTSSIADRYEWTMATDPVLPYLFPYHDAPSPPPKDNIRFLPPPTPPKERRYVRCPHLSGHH
jgi:hypothetical protein